jgi:hypothetical protein
MTNALFALRSKRSSRSVRIQTDPILGSDDAGSAAHNGGMDILDDLDQLRTDIIDFWPEGEARDLWLKWVDTLDSTRSGAPVRALN